MRETLRVVLAAGARPAEPGEFTLRAFLNGRLDLTQAEAVLNVVAARTTEGLRLAVADLAGDLSRRIAPARDAVVSLLAYLDAAADFPDDEIPVADVDADLATAEEALTESSPAPAPACSTATAPRSPSSAAPTSARAACSTPSSGPTAPSSPRSPAPPATSSPKRSTIDGIPATLLDTAGIAETADPVEQLGIERSRRALAAAAAVVLVLDGTVPPGPDDLAVARAVAESAPDGLGALPVVVAVNKRDLPERADQDDAARAPARRPGRRALLRRPARASPSSKQRSPRSSAARQPATPAPP